MRRTGVVVAACFATGSALPYAHAQSVWARAANPRAALEARVLRQSERALRRFGSATVPKGATRWSLKRRSLLQAQAMLELSGAARSPNPTMRYQLATVYRHLGSLLDDRSILEQALPLLDFVSARARATQLRADAFFDKAVTLARLGRTKAEFAPYTNAIRIEPRVLRSVVLLANLAETHMLVGQLDQAVAGYKASLQLIPTLAYTLLAPATLWGLAVALDRSGDLDAAMRRVGEARLHDPDDKALTDGSWFFAPDYDRYWFGALGHWWSARSSKALASQHGHAKKAAEQLRRFIAAAAPTDRYLKLARARLKRLENELQSYQLKMSARKAPKPPR